MAEDALFALPETKEKPHYLGHRQRLRERFLNSGGDTLPDYEILELLLFSAKPMGDVKPLAKQLIAEFGSLAQVISATPEALAKVKGLGEASIVTLKIVQESARRLLKFDMQEKPVLQSWQAVLDYCAATMGYHKIEQFRILFLDHKHKLIADEEQQRGTVNHTPVYPREVVKRALELEASSIILVHNHPSGDVTPSQADIQMTLKIQQAAVAMGITVHDHLIVGGKKHYSFAANGLI